MMFVKQVFFISYFIDFPSPQYNEAAIPKLTVDLFETIKYS